MVAVQDRHDDVENERLVKPAQNTPRTHRQWVAPTWERLETPMEVTMYVGQR